MRYLVIGAGVLGSLLTYALCQGEKDVTLLARGRSLAGLQKEGLLIYHIRQKKKTVNRIHVVEQLKADDHYDVILVAVQKSQISSLMPMLCENVPCRHIIFIGNNCAADKTAADFQAACCSHAAVWFGFLHCGGRRQNGWVHNWHPDICNFEIGPAGTGQVLPDEIADAFQGTCLRVEKKKDMNAWLKYHGAIIVPVCLAIQIENRQQNSFWGSRVLKLSIEAVKECMSFLKKENYVLDAPHDMKFLNYPTKLIQFALALLLPTRTGHYIALDHALSAEEEIEQLTQELLALAREYHAALPCLEQLHSDK